MAKFKFESERVDGGVQAPGEMRFVTTEAQVNQVLAGKDNIMDVAEVTEVQLRGIHQYIRACATGLNTSTIETVVSAVF